MSSPRSTAERGGAAGGGVTTRGQGMMPCWPSRARTGVCAALSAGEWFRSFPLARHPARDLIGADVAGCRSGESARVRKQPGDGWVGVMQAARVGGHRHWRRRSPFVVESSWFRNFLVVDCAGVPFRRCRDNLSVSSWSVSSARSSGSERHGEA